MPDVTNIPTATYRIQFHRQFGFNKAKEIVPYLNDLGISHIYASPLTQAKEGSLHGYDVVRYDQINREIGSEKEMGALVATLHSHKMGLILDIVPNHCCVSSEENIWWYDVLTLGNASPYATYFDIDWDSHYRLAKHRVLVPVLGKVLHAAIEDGDIDVVYENGEFSITYYDRWFPLHPTTSKALLERIFNVVGDKLGGSLPESPEEIDHLYRESRDFRHVLDQVLEKINGMPGELGSFDELKKLLVQQRYRLSYFRMAHERINYRRFFDIFELAGLQQQNSHVFEDTHRLIFSLIKKGWVNGLRIDHIDGLADPEAYLETLQKRCQDVAGHPFYIIVEKILSGEEPLRTHWPVAGTSGYDFMNLLNGLFVEEKNHQPFEELYRRFTGQQKGTQEVIYQAKEIVLHTLFISERKVLVRLFQQILADLHIQEEITATAIDDVVRETLALMPVYRTYIRTDGTPPGEEDLVLVHEVIQQAKSLNPSLSPSLFALLEQILTLTHPRDGVDSLSPAHREFLVRFQQLTGPVMAKGIEDTAFYRRFPLASLNEVGAELGHFGISISHFHEKMVERSRLWPYSLLSTYTHDTKRSEDARARLHALSEIPEEWEAAVSRWRQLNRGKRLAANAPDPNEEYLIYQSLVATWPFEEMDDIALDIYLQRIDLYMKKAIKEAKVHTSWVDPDDHHEKDVHLFVHQILDPKASKRFRADFLRFMKPIQQIGMWNSLSQLVVKCTVPGVPDFYQGSELWDFRLVDPDNRGLINYNGRSVLLENDEIDPLLDRMETGEIKLFVMRKLLALRREDPDLFTTGEYIPVRVKGENSSCWMAFLRKTEEKTLLVIASRFFFHLQQEERRPGAWATDETFLSVPKGKGKEVLTGREISLGSEMSLGELLGPVPFAVYMYQ